MSILSLCTGTGELDRAVEAITGARLAYVAEMDKDAALILSHRFPGVPNIGDITEFDWSKLIGHVDIITAGFPCQDISSAGKRVGINGKRSGIWRNVAEAVRVLRPSYVFLENVAAIRSRGLDRVLGDLAEIGYDVRWTCIRASDVGAAHQRWRWFCVAIPHTESDRSSRRDTSAQFARQLLPAGRGGETPGQGEVRHLDRVRGEDEAATVLPFPDSLGRDGRTGNESEAKRRPEPADLGYSPAGWWGEYLPAVRRWERVTGQAAPAPTEMGPRGGVRLAPKFAEWLMGYLPGWVTEVPGLSRGKQLKAVGNGVVALQAYEAYSWLLEQQIQEIGNEDIAA